MNGMDRTGIWLLVIIILGFAMLLSCQRVKAQEHHHPPQDVELHLRFYQYWKMPDDPKRSCCSSADCYPTDARFENGSWYGKRREDGKWLRIPPQKIEQYLTMPTPHAHMCAPAPGNPYYKPDTVFCFGYSPGI